MVGEGQAVRITTRTDARRAEIEASGAECWIGTPDRLATLRAALDGVTILCWLMGSASGSPRQLRALHTERLRFFLTQAIDTTVRGFIYEAQARRGDSGLLLAAGERTVREMTARNAIPTAFLTVDPSDCEEWLADARGAIAALLTRG
jgi:hypothetical protein